MSFHPGENDDTEDSMETPEEKTILDILNFDCFEKILEYLKFIDLFNIVNASKKSRKMLLEPSKIIFRKNFPKLTIDRNFQEKPIEDFKTMFKDYSDSVKILELNSVSYFFKDICFALNIFRSINRHFSCTLRELIINNISYILNEELNHRIFKFTYCLFGGLTVLKFNNVTLPDYITVILNECEFIQKLTVMHCTITNQDTLWIQPKDVNEQIDLKTICFKNNVGIGSYEIISTINKIAPNLKRITFDKEVANNHFNSYDPYSLLKLKYLTTINLNFYNQSPNVFLKLLKEKEIQIKEFSLIKAKIAAKTYDYIAELKSLEILKFKDTFLYNHDQKEKYAYNRLFNLKEIHLVNIQKRTLNLETFVSWSKTISLIDIRFDIELTTNQIDKITNAAKGRNLPIKIMLCACHSTTPYFSNEWLKIQRDENCNKQSF